MIDNQVLKLYFFALHLFLALSYINHKNNYFRG